MSYRDDVAALEQRCRTLESDMSASRIELEDARRLLVEAKARRHLPLLDNLHIAAPCSADWSRMTGDARVRFCGSCENHVYNLSDMTRSEAEALLVEKEGKLCVRYWQRTDGTVLTADCPTGVATRRRKRRVMAATFSAVSAVAAAASVFGARSHRVAVSMGAPRPYTVPAANGVERPTEPKMTMGEPVEMMGKIRPPQVPTRPKKDKSEKKEKKEKK